MEVVSIGGNEKNGRLIMPRSKKIVEFVCKGCGCRIQYNTASQEAEFFARTPEPPKEDPVEEDPVEEGPVEEGPLNEGDQWGILNLG